MLAAFVGMLVFAGEPRSFGSPVVLDDIQKGVVTLADGAASLTVQIEPVVLASSVLQFSVNAGSGSPDDLLVTGRLTATDTVVFSRFDTDGPVAIDFSVLEFSSGVTVQRGETTLASVPTDIPITAVDLTKSFVLLSYRSPEFASTFGADDFVTGALTTSTNLQLSGVNCCKIVAWQVVEYADSVVQSGLVSLSTSDSSTTATIGAVDTSRAWLLYSYGTTAGSSNDIGQKLLRGTVTNSTTLTFDRSNTGTTVNIRYFVVEFTDATTVQRGTASMTTGSTVDTTITAVAPNRAIVSAGSPYLGGRSPYAVSDQPGVTWSTGRLTTSTNLRLQRAMTAASTDIAWQVVHWPGTDDTVIVNSTDDDTDLFPGDGYCDTGQFNSSGHVECTLRAAVQEASAAASPIDHVHFAIPTTAAGYSAANGGFWTISPSSSITVTGSTITIDATTQTGYIGTPKIRLDGSGAGASADGFNISGDDVTVRGFAIGGYATGDAIDTTAAADRAVIQSNYIGTDITGTSAAANGTGVRLHGADALVGGVGAGNVISGSTGHGIYLENVAGATVSANRIGTTVSGVDPLGNGGHGVRVDNGSAIVIGGATSLHGNVIGSNGADGLYSPFAVAGLTVRHNTIGLGSDGSTALPNPTGLRIEHATSVVVSDNTVSGNSGDGVYIGTAGSGATVTGNFVGTDATGLLDRGNTGNGISIGAPSTVLGSLGAGNVVSGNGNNGVYFAATSDNSVMQSNLVGVGADGVTPLGNDGIGLAFVGAVTDVLVGGVFLSDANTIAHNGNYGIWTDNNGADDLAWLGNSIHSNAQLGIDLGNNWISVNDPSDADSGANGLLNYPVITTVTSTGPSTADVDFTMSQPAGTYRVEFFRNPGGGDPTGYGEGRFFAGSTSVTHAGSGSFTASITAVDGDVITAIATEDLGGGVFGSSSEFSPVSAALVVDSDGDGLLDRHEDDDPDGDSNPSTSPGPDTDGDTLVDHLDADDDADGIPTASENADANADGDPRDAADGDFDGEPDYLDPATVNTTGAVVSSARISAIEGDLTGPLAANARFGSAVEAIGDLDGDGVVDLAVGVNGDGDGGGESGAVFVLFMNADGSVKAEQKISNSQGDLAATLDPLDQFGSSLARIGDLDGDGRPELAVGAHLDDDGSADAGAVYILFLHADGRVRDEHKISASSGDLTITLESGDNFGYSVGAVGDIDGDGIPDLIAGIYGDDDGGVSEFDRGAAIVLFMNADGTVKGEQKISETEGLLSVGLSPGDRFGSDVDGLGDIDGDGVPDVAVGASAADDGALSAGEVYVLRLNATGTVKGAQKISNLDGGLSATLEANDFFGDGVAGIGDVDLDGVPDVAVGAQGDDDGATDAGAVYIFTLTSTGSVASEFKLSAASGGVPPAHLAGGRAGFRVASTGDLDGDGTIGLAVGAHLDDAGFTDGGAVLIWDLMSAVDTDGDGLFDNRETPFGDTDGDTFPDWNDADDDGDSTATASENADPNGDGDPRDALDIDRDGQPDYRDLPTAPTGGVVADAQKISNTEGAFGGSLADGDRLGHAVDALGDVDGDGVVDMVVTPWNSSFEGSGVGAVYVVFLNPDGTVKGEQRIGSGVGGGPTLGGADWFGQGAAGVGDIDGDGVPDLVVGARGDDDGAVDAGAVYVLFLNSDGTARESQKISNAEGGFTGPLAQQDWFGYSVGGLGDVNGDGVNDIIVGAYGDDTGGTGRGSAWVLLLDSDGMVIGEQKIASGTGGLSAPLTDIDVFGMEVAGIGDIDGDGIPDAAVGAPRDDDGGGEAGAIYVLFLDATGAVRDEQKISNLDGDLAATLSSNFNFGDAIAGIGDLDVDGVPDIVVGASGGGSSGRGELHVLFLTALGRVRAEQKITQLESGFHVELDSSELFGDSATGLGDLDGDGLINIAVGAPLDDDGGFSRGAAYVLDLRPFNNAPVLDNTGTMTLTSITENDVANAGDTVAAIVASAGGDRITDVDADPEGILIENFSVGVDKGWWEFSVDAGASWTRLNTHYQGVVLRTTDRVRYVPGGYRAETATLTVRAWDQSWGTPGQPLRSYATGGTGAVSAQTENVSITVLAVNDAPRFGLPGSEGVAGGGGWTTWRHSPRSYDVSALVEAPSGDIYIVGYTDTLANAGNDDVLLARFDADGALDTGFGANGYAIVPIGASNDRGLAISVLDDGRIYVAGEMDVGGTWDAFLARFTARGALDATFGGGDGWVSYDPGAAAAEATAVMVQSDGRPVIAGGVDADLLVARFTTAGVLDATYGTGGVQVHAGVPNAADADIQTDDKIVTTGTLLGSDEWLAVRLTTTGALDTSFDTDGIASTTLGLTVGTTTANTARAIAVAADGDIVVTGDSIDYRPVSFRDDHWTSSVVRFTTTGALDTTFNGTGFIRVERLNGAGYSGNNAIAVWPDGRVVTFGTIDEAYKGGNTDVVFARFTAGGALDTGFGDGGFVAPRVGRDVNRAHDVIVAANGDVVGLGSIDWAEPVLFRLDANGAEITLAAGSGLDATPRYAIGGAPVVLDSDLRPWDKEIEDLSNWSGASVTIERAGGPDPADEFVASGGLSTLNESGGLVIDGITIGTVTTNSGGTLRLDFSAAATDARVWNALEAIAYQNLVAGPGTVDLVWTLNDGTGGSNGGQALTVTIERFTVRVNSTGDAGDATPGDGVCDTGGVNAAFDVECTLRAAIEEINALGAGDIAFELPAIDPNHSGGVWTISPITSQLPNIAAAGAVLDATSQPGWAGAPVVVIDGSNRGSTDDGLQPVAANVEVRGFSIVNWPDDGGAAGVNGVVFAQNWFGLLPDGTVAANGSADFVVFSSATGVTLGGPDAADGNRFGFGGAHQGIFVSETASGTIIENNVFGLRPDGVSSTGAAQSVVIGDTTSGTMVRSNRFAHISAPAISIVNSATGIVIVGNTFGLDELGGAASVQQAVWTNTSGTIRFGGLSPAEANTVRNGTAGGVDVGAGSTTLTLLGNSIAAIGSLGFDLNDGDGVTANDPGDADPGPNGLLNFPVITSATESGSGVLAVDFALDVPAGDYRIEVFANPSGANPLGNGDGEVFIGATTITHPGGGTQAFVVEVAGSPGDVLTATATEDLGGGSFGATSEFSAAFTAVANGGSVLDQSSVRGDLTAVGGAAAGAGAGVVGTGFDLGGGTERFSGFGRDVIGSGLTVEGWVNLTSAGSAPRLVGKGTQGSPAVFELTVEAGQAVGRLHVGGSTVVVAGGTIATAVWYHLAATWDGSTARLYVDGVEVDSAAAAGAVTLDVAAAVTVGGDGSTGGSVDGSVDGVRISLVARSAGWLAATAANATNTAFVQLGPEQLAVVGVWDATTGMTRSGSYALEAPAAGAGTEAWATVAGLDSNGLAFDAWWYLTNPATADVGAGNHTGLVPTDQRELSLGGGTVELSTNESLVRTVDATSATSIAPSTWTRAEIRTDETGTSSVWINGVQVIAPTAHSGGSTGGSAGLRASAVGAGSWFVDDVVIRQYVSDEPTASVGPLHRN